MSDAIGRITLVGGEKGGAGKSTDATNIAVVHAKNGKRTCLVDADIQSSANLWSYMRDENAVEPRIPVFQKYGKNLWRELLELAKDYDEIVVDTAGRDSIEMRSAMGVAQVMIVPMKPSCFDLWTLRRLDLMAEEAYPRNPELKIHLVISQASTNMFLAEDTIAAKDMVREFQNFNLIETIICERIAYRRAAGQGMSVIEYEHKNGEVDNKAAQEILDLYEEVYK